MARVARDTTTGEMKGLWDEAGEGETEPDVPDGCEVIDLPGETAFEVVERIKKQAGGDFSGAKLSPAGEILEARKAQRPPTIASEIRKERENRGARPDAPVTLDELEEWERRFRGGV